MWIISVLIRVSIRTRGEREEGVMRDGYTDKHHLNLDKKNLKLHHVSYYIKRETHVGEEPLSRADQPFAFFSL